MEKVRSSDSESSVELPELNPTKTFDVEKLENGCIVWAGYKGLHWPALVRSVDKKNKKVKVWYLDTPGKCFKVPFKRIENFEDIEINKKVLNEAKLNPQRQKHYGVFRRSLLFLFRRSDGMKDDPAEFFDTSKPYFLRKAYVEPGNSENKFTSENISADKVGDNLPESSECESLHESDEENHSITKSFPELCVENSPYSEEEVDKIIACITAGHVNEHLMNVVNSEIVNERHDLFVEASKSCNIELLSSSPSYIPIVDNEKLKNISVYLSDLYEQKIGKDKFKMSEYVISVWLPEAVDKAISLIEAEVKEKINESSSCSEVVAESAKSTNDDDSKGYNQETEEVNVETNGKSAEQPIDFSLEAEVKEKINESSSCSEVVADSSKSTIDDDSKGYNQETKEVNVETNGKSAEQPIDCGNGASAIFPRETNGKSAEQPIDCGSGASVILPRNAPSQNYIEVIISSSEDTDSTIEVIDSSPEKQSSDENNEEAASSNKRKCPFKNSSAPRKRALQKIAKLEEKNLISSTESSENEEFF